VLHFKFQLALSPIKEAFFDYGVGFAFRFLTRTRVNFSIVE